MKNIEYQKYPLPFDYSSLEPYIDSETMKVHYDNLYTAYTQKLNQAYDKYGVKKSIVDILKNHESYPKEFRQQGGGYLNHSMLWNFLTAHSKSTEPSNDCLRLMKRDFLSVGNFKRILVEQGLEVFGSGWVWWCMDRDGSTSICTMANQDNPYMINQYPLFGIDIWEHAYFLKYKSSRKDYLENIWNVTNWKYVNERIASANKK
jgi:Fe-Mn family superoxide dismutase